MKHTDIVRDILSVHVSRDPDRCVWCNSVSGRLTSRMAYDLLRSAHPRVGWSSWIWGGFIPPCRSTLIWRAIWGKIPTADWLRHFGVLGPTVCFLCHNASETLDHIFVHCSFTRTLLCKVANLFGLTLYYDIGFLDVFIQATSSHFGKQLGCLWQCAFITSLWSVWHARNKAVFEEVQPSTQRSFAFVLASIKEMGQLDLGHMVSSVNELIILSRLGLSGRPAPPRSTTVIRWKPPHRGWIKMNMDGSVPSSPGSLFAGAIFRNSRGFFVAAFTKTVVWGYPLEAELASIMHAILFAFDQGWLSL
ncbi:hypothetical protein ACS0TY_018337 [Phlomoides rotata]